MNGLGSSLSETLRSKLASGRSRLGSAWLYIRSGLTRSKRAAQYWYALQWQYIYRAHYRFSLMKSRYGFLATTALLILLIMASAILAPNFQGALEPYFLADERFAGLRTLLVTLGGSLVGAAAIAFSLVMFAMQVNVERMPHGLFRKFSSDPKLLGAFCVTFLLAIGVATLSLVQDRSRLAAAILMAGWGTVLILVLFLFVYRRALALISPTQQLALVVADAQRDLRAWVRRSQRAAPLLEDSEKQSTEQESRLRSTHDLPRVTYFRLNPHWTSVAQRAILHSVSFARRYAEQGDHEVSSVALSAIVAINAAYVEAKGKTFFTTHLMLDNPLSRDTFIMETLEYLRQNIQIGISRGDEQQIEQTFRTIAALCRIFLSIDYATENASKTHTHLAAGYLSSAVQSVVPHNMPDVLMEGVRLMGEVAQFVLSCGEPNDIATITEKIALISCTGVAREDYRPVTQVGMEQLAKLTFELIRSGSHDIQFPAREIRDDVSLIVKLFLNLPETPLSSIHSTYLAPYYSGTSTETLQRWLTELGNVLMNAEADDEIAQRVIGHIEQWADGLYQTEKEILLVAIQKRSHFTFDIVHWVTHVTKLLLAVSNAPACKDYTRDELRKSALWLISVLSWVPDDKEAITFVENFQMTGTLFDAALDAHNRDCDEVTLQIHNLLLSWMFKAGKYENGWAILERACYGLVTLDLLQGKDGTALMAEISERLSKEGAPGQAIRDRAAREIRRQAVTFRDSRYTLERIEYAMGQVDQTRLRDLLMGISNRLSPGTAGEPVHSLDVF